jgi:rRNA maturation endonuclease Nob1
MKGPEANPQKAKISPEQRRYDHLQPMDHRHDLRSLRATAEEALNALPGVKAQASYEEGIARVTAPEDLGIERVIERVEAKGFKANSRKEDARPEPVATN